MCSVRCELQNFQSSQQLTMHLSKQTTDYRLRDRTPPAHLQVLEFVSCQHTAEPLTAVHHNWKLLLLVLFAVSASYSPSVYSCHPGTGTVSSGSFISDHFFFFFFCSPLFSNTFQNLFLFLSSGVAQALSSLQMAPGYSDLKYKE